MESYLFGSIKLLSISLYSGAAEGENISDATGSLSRMETDFSLPGRGGLDFTLGRLYESNEAYIEEPKITGNAGAYANGKEYYTYMDKKEKIRDCILQQQKNERRSSHF
ncbi:hypothetical protein [Saccharibacillus brassicae]|uniref:Uncharacterized protein n=1 Tax=Saccharibacillus brassicae TaxID=2583377 RepID=A0A4Y6UZ36_SACBS|nr:hypothetical protein [Saccharibacillus brassicae]QDH21621.1 hypothetical protein FFV09_12665 [Saccharibacillus brassicae]